MGMSAEWIMLFFCKQTKGYEGYLTKDRASEAAQKRFGFHFWSICTWFHWLIKQEREGTNPCTKMHSHTLMQNDLNFFYFILRRISVSETFKQSVLNVLITQKLRSFGRLVPPLQGKITSYPSGHIIFFFQRRFCANNVSVPSLFISTKMIATKNSDLTIKPFFPGKLAGMPTVLRWGFFRRLFTCNCAHCTIRTVIHFPSESRK